MHLVAPPPTEFPVRLWAEDEQLRSLMAISIDLWNTLRPGLFAEHGAPEGSYGVLRRTAGRTWVDMDASPRIVWCGTDQPLEEWLPHELGHVLGIGDNIWAYQLHPGYRDPRILDPYNPSYKGVMSYYGPPWGRDGCRWFGDDDRLALDSLFPLPRRSFLGGLTANG